jgi:hypothetical protein
MRVTSIVTRAARVGHILGLESLRKNPHSDHRFAFASAFRSDDGSLQRPRQTKKTITFDEDGLQT